MLTEQTDIILLALKGVSFHKTDLVSMQNLSVFFFTDIVDRVTERASGL